jgi:hypothetical protein
MGSVAKTGANCLLTCLVVVSDYRKRLLGDFPALPPLVSNPSMPASTASVGEHNDMSTDVVMEINSED